MKSTDCMLVLLCLAAGVRAELSFAPVFNDGAVLQCDMPVNIWGKADPGATVTVSFAGQDKTTVASDRGEWQVVLDPMEASAESRKLTVSSSIENQKSEISNVVVGEVWLASGQSNMVRPLHVAHGGAERLNETIPAIRFVVVPQKTGVPVEQPLIAAELNWNLFSPANNRRIAAVAFFFAEEIYKKTGRPVGILQSAVGGTHAHVWTPLFALRAHPELQRYVELCRKRETSGKTDEEWKKELSDFDQFRMAQTEWEKKKDGSPPKAVPAPGFENPFYTRYPGVFFENMIAPLVPYTARGVIWYQGEANTGGAEEYRVLFPVLIDAWRKVWGRSDWPFFFVQMAAYDTKENFAGLRSAQTFTRDTVPNTGMALAIDCGDRKDIHPWAKQPVGERLARLALDRAETKLKLPPQISRFVLTCGASANQNGTALFEGVVVLFLAQVYGLNLGIEQQFIVVFFSVLAGVGTAGVPGGSLPLIAILCVQVGIPVEGMGLILGVDRFLDMCRTALNVSGDLVIAKLVSADITQSDLDAM